MAKSIISGQQALALDENSPHPYLRRQAAMRTAIRYALDQENGLFPLPAPTGSGKNYCASEVIADILAEGFTDDGKFLKALPHKSADPTDAASEPVGRRYIFAIVPQKDNRRSFAKSIKGALKRKHGKSAAEANALVLDLPSASDGVKEYFLQWKTDKDGRRIRVFDNGKKTCPFKFSKKETNRAAKRKYNSLVDAAKRVHELESNAFTDPKLLDDYLKTLRESEGAMRAFLKECIKDMDPATKAGQLEIISRLWPASRLEGDKPAVIICTPQKLLYPIDRVLAPPIDALSSGISSQTIYIMDEFDHQKSDWLSVLLEAACMHDPIGYVKFFRSRFLSENHPPSPLLRGDEKAWIREYFGWAEVRKKERVSLDDMPKPSEMRSYAAAVEKAYLTARDEVYRTYGKYHLEYELAYGLESAKLSEKEEEEEERTARLFDIDSLCDLVDVNGSKGKKKIAPLTAKPDRSRELHIITPSQGEMPSESFKLRTMLRDSRQAIRMVLALFDRVEERIARLAAPVSTQYARRKSILSQFGFDASQPMIDPTIQIWSARARAKQLLTSTGARESRDISLYTRGVSMVKMEELKDPERRILLNNLSLETLPEAIIADIARFAPILAMSATWSAPSVTNWDCDHLEDVEQVFPADKAGWQKLLAPIERETSNINDEDGALYSRRAHRLQPPAAIADLSAIDEPDPLRPAIEIESAALQAALELGLDEAAAEQAIDILCKFAKDEKADASENDRDPSSKARHSLNRALRYLVAACEWASGALRGDNYAGLLLTQIDLNKKTPMSKTARKLIELAIDSASRAEGAAAAHIAAAAETLYIFNARTWDDEEKGFNALRRRLESGKPGLGVVNLATGSFSKNPQYMLPPEEALPAARRGKAVTLPHGVPCGPTPEMDFDFIYIESPTNRLTCPDPESPSNGKDNEKDKENLEFICEQKQLVHRSELTPFDAERNIRRVLSAPFSLRQQLGLTKLDSSRVEGARIVAQAVGRLSRTHVKSQTVVIALDEQLADNCDFEWLDNLPPTLELLAVREALGCPAPIAASIAAPRPVWANIRLGQPLKAETLAGKAEISNAKARRAHMNLLDKLFDENASERDLAAFDSERDQALRNPLFDWDDNRLPTSELSHTVHTPFPCKGYVYWQENDFAKVRIELPAPGEPDLAAARGRLRTRLREDGKPNEPIQEVSLAEARLGELLSVPIVSEHFAARGYLTNLDATTTGHLTPYIHQCVYKGALGEEALLAILSDYLAPDYRLERGSAQEAERTGDFTVKRADGSSTGVWIDAKHYNLRSYVTGGDEGESDESKFLRKAAENDAKRLIAVNVLADGVADLTKPRAVGASGKIFSVPYLIRDGAVDYENCRRIREWIEEA
jgi:hypothetical protein